MKENQEDFEIQDESNDKKYFTIVPNYILNHSTVVAQGIYLQLKRLAGENGIAYPSNKYLVERLGITYKVLRTEVKYLLDKGWIKVAEPMRVPVGRSVQKIRAYKMVDIWKLNVDEYQKAKGLDGSTTRKAKGLDGSTTHRLDGSTTKEYIESKEQDRVLVPSTLSSVASDERESFDSDQYIKEKLIKAKDKRRDLWIIGQYLKARQIKYQSEAQVGVAIKRHLRAAQSLKEFSDADLKWASSYCEEKSDGRWDWNLDTMVKALTSGTREEAHV